jgi:hypothetical protein
MFHPWCDRSGVKVDDIRQSRIDTALYTRRITQQNNSTPSLSVVLVIEGRQDLIKLATSSLEYDMI